MTRKARPNSKAAREISGDTPSEKTAAPLSLRKRLIFSVVGFVLIPLLLLACLEVLLRFFGVGYPTTYFLPSEKEGRGLMVSNERFGMRFFPPQIARSPAPLRMPAQKAPGVYRIFIFGESAAQGDPRPAYGAARFLEVLLTERYPSNRFEVINTSMTAINSHAILPIARECASLSGDAWIIYMGNNEMVGPFGATTVFGAQSPSISFVRFSLWLQSTRIGQGIFGLARHLGKGGVKAGTWGGMSMFLDHKVRPDAPRKVRVYRNFQRNLEDTLAVAKAASVRVLLNTIAVNLSDCAPFASEMFATARHKDDASLRKDLEQGAMHEIVGNMADAEKTYISAVSRNTGWAEAEFRLGRFLSRHSNATMRAAVHLQKACDLDALPFRADSEINKVIRQASARLGHGGQLFDAAGTFNNTEGAGTEAFFEHVHFNFDGNYRLALAWADKISSWLPTQFSSATNVWASQARCEERLALTDWNKRGVLRDVLRRMNQPPFTGQSDHNARVEQLRAQMQQLSLNTTTNAVETAHQVYLRALEKAPGDLRLREGYAEFLEDIGRIPDAANQWDHVSEAFPTYHAAHFHAGRLRLQVGELQRAEANLTSAVTLRPELGEGWLLRGQIQAMQGNHQQALEFYKRDRDLAPGDERAHYHIGRSLCALKHPNEGMASFREALRLRPSFWEARYALAEELAFSGKVAEAAQEFETVLRQNPGHVMAHVNLGVARFQQGRQEDARQLFSRALELDPKNERAASYLQILRDRAAQRAGPGRNEGRSR